MDCLYGYGTSSISVQFDVSAQTVTFEGAAIPSVRKLGGHCTKMPASLGYPLTPVLTLPFSCMASVDFWQKYVFRTKHCLLDCSEGGYVECSCGEETVTCFHKMQMGGIAPHAITSVGGLESCGS